MKKWVIKSGIQRKYLRYIMGLLLLAILLSSIGVWIYVRQSLTTEVTDKYEFLNEKMGLGWLWIHCQKRRMKGQQNVLLTIRFRKV